MSPFIVPVAFFIMMAVIFVGTPLARAYARQIERESALRNPSDLAQRLERMEHAIDSIALEVERISEGQRFLTKALAARSESAAPLSASAGAPPRQS
jgi:hypothetical protein